MCLARPPILPRRRARSDAIYERIQSEQEEPSIQSRRHGDVGFARDEQIDRLTLDEEIGGGHRIAAGYR